MRFVADEGCDFAVVRALRAAGHDVTAILEISPRADDTAIIDLAVREQRVLLTEDKDFGELVYANARAASGVILIRFPGDARATLPSAITALVNEKGEQLFGCFVKEFLYQQPALLEVEYLFKHALTQEVAYNSVLIERRKALHEQTAQAIEQLYHDQIEEHCSELAHHYSRSGSTHKAIEYLHKAGQQAVQRSAHGDATRLVSTVLELVQTLADTPGRVLAQSN